MGRRDKAVPPTSARSSGLPSPCTFTLLHLFDNTSGAVPLAAPVEATDGNFYGTTSQGGAPGRGTIFRMTRTGVVTALHAFAGADGSGPVAALIQATDGSFYGTTQNGGAANFGTVFTLLTDGAVAVVHSFTGSDGSGPVAALLQANDGNLYGRTFTGGPREPGSSSGPLPAGIVTRLHAFTGQDGTGLAAALIQGADGHSRRAISLNGPPSSRGMIFQMTAGGTLTTLHTFNGIDGFMPATALVQSADGSFYGTKFPGWGELRYRSRHRRRLSCQIWQGSRSERRPFR